MYYYIDDMLGSSRTIVKDGQTSACYEADFYPFGGERDINVSCVQNYKFEGKERDGETQNDNFGARYYSNRFGRWLSVDWTSVPTPVPYANLSNPQTLNLYAMVSDNPETFADLDGHGCSADGEPHGSVWCWLHDHHLFGVETKAEHQADQVKDARALIAANGFDLINVNGHWQPASSSSDSDVASWWKDYNNAYRDNLGQGMSAAGAFGLLEGGGGGGFRLTNAQVKDLAEWSGMDAVKDPPFDPHGQKVFKIGNRYFSPDVDSHSGGVWKEFDRQGRRIATLDVYLNKIGD